MSARRVVNGTDRARLIAAYAQAFEAALNAARSANKVTGEISTTGKRMHRSKTNWSALITMITGGVTAIAAAIREVADSIGPMGLAVLAIAGTLAALVIMRERKLKADLEGV